MKMSEHERAKYFAKRAEKYSSSGQFGKATRCLELAINCDHGLDKRAEADLHVKLAQAFDNQRLFSKSIEHYRLALKLGAEPEADIHQAIGLALHRSGEYEDAIRALKEAINAKDSKHPGDIYYLRAAGLCELGKLCKDQKQREDYHERAVKDYRKVLTLDRSVEEWEVDNGLGYLHMMNHDYGEAIQRFRSALDSGLCDIAGNIWNNLGDAYWRRRLTHDEDDAIKCFRQAAKDDNPSTAGYAYLRIGDVRESQRLPEKALNAYEIARDRYIRAKSISSSSPFAAVEKLEYLDTKIAELSVGRCFKNGQKCPCWVDNPTKNMVFVMMPFGKTDKKKAHYNEVYRVIQEVMSHKHLECSRADSNKHPRDITCDICQDIQKANILVADLSEKNANAYYELGHAHARNKPVITIASSVNRDLVFDVKTMRCLQYDSNVDKLRRELPSFIEEVLQSMDSLR